MDCEHLAIEVETRDMKLSNSITYSHTLRCAACRLSAIVFEHVAVAP